MAWTMSTLTLLVVACAVVLVGCHGTKTGRNGRAPCVYENKVYRVRPGRRFKPDVCTTCHCTRRGGRARCSIEDCREQPNCLQFAKFPKCCPACLRYGCLHSDGKVYQPGTVVSVNKCTKCVCPTSGGRTVCTNVPCPPLRCVDAVADPGECCRRCINGDNCWLDKEIVPAGKMVRAGRCKICQCPLSPLPHWQSSDRRRAVCSKLSNCS